MTLWHKQLEQRFSDFPPHQQIIMVCNELNRARFFLKDIVEYKNCLERALELMDFIIDDEKWMPKIKEILRARGIIAQYYLQPPRETGLLQQQLIQLDTQAWRMFTDT